MVVAVVVAMEAGTQPHLFRLGSAQLGPNQFGPSLLVPAWFGPVQLGSARRHRGAKRWSVGAGIKSNTAVGLTETGADGSGVRSRDEKGDPGLGM